MFGDAGPAVLPALTSVYKAGKVVVPYRVDVGGKAGQNYTQFIGASFKNDGENWGKWIKQILPNGGNLLFLSGPAGNSQGLDELAGLKAVLDDKYKFLNPAPFDVTNWDPALTQQVLTAEISKHDKIDVIVSDFGPSLVGALTEFKKFNRSVPALATSDGNSLGCFWTDNHAANPGLQAVHGRHRQRQRASGGRVGGRFSDGRQAAERGHLQGARCSRIPSRASRIRSSAARTCPARSICPRNCRGSSGQSGQQVGSTNGPGAAVRSGIAAETPGR